MIYYDVANDLRDYPEAVAYFIIGGNRTGKTFSALRYSYENGKKIAFVKRTKIDVSVLCSGLHSGGKISEITQDVNPFHSLNKKYGWNVRAAMIDAECGFGGFWEYDPDGHPVGEPVGYIVALSQIQKIKGFDMDDCDLMIFDEFIPVKGETIKKNEGDSVLILHTLINNARELQDDPRPSLKMICLANSMQLNAPVLQTLRLTDPIADMKAKGEAVRYLEDKRTLIHLLDDNEEYRAQAEEKIGLMKVAEGTRWKATALNNDFSYDDFSQIRPLSIKGLRPRYEILYNMVDRFVIYKGRGIIYCSSAGAGGEIINTDTDAGHLKFASLLYELRPYMREGKLYAEKFSQYAFIRDFKP